MRPATLVLILFAGRILYAADKFDWPPPVVAGPALKAKWVKVEFLPSSLRSALLLQDEFAQGTGALPTQLFVASIDLNGDGTEEFIVDSQQFYSGGTAHLVFQNREGRYELIAYFQGPFYLASRVDGYFRICAVMRGGPRDYTYSVFHYVNGEYREKMCEQRASYAP